MTSPSPLPPPAGSSVAVRPVMFGEAWTDPNGVEHLADANLVFLQLIVDGDVVATRTQSPESAIALGRLLVDAAGRCFRDEVDDEGRTISAVERLSRFNTAWNGS